MQDIETVLEQLMIEKIPVFCQKCHGKMRQIDKGLYQCSKCGNQEADGFRKIEDYLAVHENEDVNKSDLMRALNISEETVNRYVRWKDIKESDEKHLLLTCNNCGTRIPQGRYCKDCMKVLVGGIREELLKDEK